MPSFTVGICVMPSKLKKLNLPGCVEESCRKDGISLVVIDPSVPATGKYDVILQKVLDFKAYDEVHGTNWFVNAVELLRSGRAPLILDPLELALNLADREWTMNLARKCEFSLNNISVFVPKFLSVTEEIDASTFEKKIDAAELRYPVLVKQQLAAGSKSAHAMALVFSKDKLLHVSTPCLIQEFVNHGGIMYKIFLCGKKHYIVERPSVQNLEAGNRATEPFVSLDISKLRSRSKLHSAEIATMKFRTSETAELLDHEVVVEFIKRLRENEFEFNMLGIDVLIEETTGNYGIVDINYLPGYDGVLSHFAQDMSDLIRNKCIESRNQGINGNCNGN